MDRFTDNAQNLNVSSTLATGAVFGVFLTIGNAWAEFLKSLSLKFMESIISSGSEVDPLAVNFIAAMITSIVCIFSVILLLHGGKCIQCFPKIVVVRFV